MHNKSFIEGKLQLLVAETLSIDYRLNDYYNVILVFI